MKTLNNYINEWKLNDQSSKTIDYKKQYTKFFIYKLTKEIIEQFQSKQLYIFGSNWAQLKDYRNKVYINGEHVKIDNAGGTEKEYELGEYKVFIEDLNNVKTCTCMFDACDSLIKATFFDTSKVKEMHAMFSSCINLKEVPLYNTENVKNMSYMFNQCCSLETVPLFDTTNVIDMDNMFFACSKLTYVPKFNTINLRYMDEMFWSCNNLEEVPLFDIRNIECMDSTFRNCPKLNDRTKKDWRKVYNFHTNRKK